MSVQPDPQKPDRRLIFLLNAGHRRVQRWIEAKMAAKGGLTAAQSGVLFFLGERDGALIGEAADALDLAPSAMTGLIDTTLCYSHSCLNRTDTGYKALVVLASHNCGLRVGHHRLG